MTEPNGDLTRPRASRATARIVVPIPGIVALVGPAGVGKTTFAARFFAADEVLSSDDLRGAIGRDPADQSVTRIAFRILHGELLKRVSAGRLVVVDATNLTQAARAALLRRAALAGAPTVAILLVAPASVVRERNARRPGRIVPAEIVERQLVAMAALGVDEAAMVQRLTSEGFAAVHAVSTAGDLAEIEIIRLNRPPPAIPR